MIHVLLTLYLLVTVAELTLTWINLRHMRRHGMEIPPGFEGLLDQDTLRKSVDYAAEHNHAGFVESIIDVLAVLLFLFGGLIRPFDNWVMSLSNSFVLQGVLFFLTLYLAQVLLAIPFSLYRTFSIESRYGFNTMTPRLWLTDFLKATALGMLLIAVLVAGAFGLISFSQFWWWLWVWVFFAVISLFLLYVSPYIIEPLFNRFEPVVKEGLEEDIRCLMDKAGLKVSRVLKVDASRRSQHSNAYFTGIGSVKRIVLFDTLLERLENREILAVLAHETGHWKRRHLLKRLVIAEAQALAVCFITYLLLKSGRLPPIFGAETASLAAQLVFTGFLFSLAASLFTPFGNWLSRRHEQQADSYAAELSGMPDALASALIKIGRDNLSNLHPHSLYAAIYYSHPPLAERVLRLLSMTGTGRLY
jgi:STE24 endopeptidase